MLKTTRNIIILVAATFTFSCNNPDKLPENSTEFFSKASSNGLLVNEGFNRCLDYVDGWLKIADPETGLIPRNVNDEASKDIWNAKDCAADNYPFMVLTSALLNRELFTGKMMEMLETEKRLTSRIGSMPDTYSFSKKAFSADKPVLDDIIFGSAEYIKDGLIPLTEWLGPSPWSERMISIMDDAWANAVIETPFGNICSVNTEVNGDMLQALSRIYWLTEDKKYLEWAIRLGDYYLLGDNHPTDNFEVLRLRDHGCEIISGLCELYATLSAADQNKKKEYQPHIHRMLDRILETGRNADGLFYNSIDPVKGIPVNSGIADNFGYNLNGFYTVYIIDEIEKYRTPVIEALEVLNSKYRNFAWEGTSSDGYADAIEGALNLYTREPVAEAAEWIDSEIKVMWNKQQPTGIIEGWHGDGNFARTTIMYCLWKTGGAYAQPWKRDLNFGGVWHEGALFLSIESGSDWEGSIIPDIKRHKEYLKLPFDWPRINQFPEYFTVEREKSYRVIRSNSKKSQVLFGHELLDGLKVSLKAGEKLNLVIQDL